MCIMPYAFAQLHPYTNTCILTPTHGVWARACDTRVTHNGSVGDGVPPNRHVGFNTGVGKLFVCRYFFFFFLSSLFCTLKKAHMARQRDIKTWKHSILLRYLVSLRGQNLLFQILDMLHSNHSKHFINHREEINTYSELKTILLNL